MRYIINCDPRLQIEKPYETLAAPEIVYLTGEINEESAWTFRRDMEVAEMNALAADQEILPVCIDSGGGCLYALMGMIDAMDACSVKIATVVECKAMSAALVLSSCGDFKHRYAGPNSTLMIHSASGRSLGKMEELEADTKELRRLFDLAFTRMEKNCGQKKGFFAQHVRNKGAEWFLSPKEAKRFGLISRIGIPVMKTHIGYTHSFDLK